MVTEKRKEEKGKEQPKHHNAPEWLSFHSRSLYSRCLPNIAWGTTDSWSTHYFGMERIISLTQKAGIATLVVGVTIDFFIYDVDAGKRAVIFDMLQGVQQTTIGEGTHFKIPYIQVLTFKAIVA